MFITLFINSRSLSYNVVLLTTKRGRDGFYARGRDNFLQPNGDVMKNSPRAWHDQGLATPTGCKMLSLPRAENSWRPKFCWSVMSSLFNFWKFKDKSFLIGFVIFMTINSSKSLAGQQWLLRPTSGVKPIAARVAILKSFFVMEITDWEITK